MIDVPRTGMLPQWLEQAWLQRYLDRELSDPETEWFETYAIDKAHLVDAIEADNTLRDALHAWHAEAQATPAPAPAAAIREIRPDYPALPVTRARRWSRPLAAAASLAVAAVLGAGASQWLETGHADATTKISSPRRVVFDNLRGSSAGPLAEPARTTPAPLLIDVAVPPQADDVVALFADGSRLALAVSSDGFVSLVGTAADLRRLSPIRLAYQLAGQPIERALDLGSVLDGAAH